ncbi:hypothetical protein FA13DRAFT_1711971 [Coprinellus micaceus]|uniref:Uncharacterized protein n=1 Tax=Coprinellus micaceus TaxID=71717 RepID=A0A4Y7T1V4_COPMI|nr:hypothetical protein FA13DRAFT_1711971 [Coprinellus micaceus]
MLAWADCKAEAEVGVAFWIRKFTSIPQIQVEMPYLWPYTQKTATIYLSSDLQGNAVQLRGLSSSTVTCCRPTGPASEDPEAKITGNGSSRKKLGVGKKMAGWVLGNRVQDTTKYWWMVKGMF